MKITEAIAYRIAYDETFVFTIMFMTMLLVIFCGIGFIETIRCNV